MADGELLYPEGAVTHLRREFKLLLGPDAADRLTERLAQQLGAAQGQAGPRATRIVSVYFDRPGLPLATRARCTPQDCLKVRTKEYAPDLGGGRVPRVVLEFKRERHGLTRKRRLWLPRTELAGWIRRGSLLPILAVSYERRVYQVADAWRVTVDRDVAYHPITLQLALGPEALCVATLPEPHGRDARVVVEVKHLGEATLPPWLEALRGNAALRYSKFMEGMALRQRQRPWDGQAAMG